MTNLRNKPRERERYLPQPVETPGAKARHTSSREALKHGGHPLQVTKKEVDNHLLSLPAQPCSGGYVSMRAPRSNNVNDEAWVKTAWLEVGQRRQASALPYARIFTHSIIHYFFFGVYINTVYLNTYKLKIQIYSYSWFHSFLYTNHLITCVPPSAYTHRFP